jgi:hypothetical protein
LIARELILRRAVSRRENIVLALVGKTPDSILEQVDILHQAGYDVHLYLVELPLHTAAIRAVHRFHAIGRLVDPVYVLSIDGGPHQTYDRVIHERSLSSYGRLSTDVPHGSDPKVSYATIPVGEDGFRVLLRSIRSG